MKTVKKMAAQGDVVFRRIKAMPRGVIEQKENGPIIVAHSETGHHHVVDGRGASLFRASELGTMISFLNLLEPTDIVHKREYHTHETLRLEPGVWEVRRQREHAPEGWRQVAD